MIYDILLDTIIDCLKMLPFLFGAFLLIEVLEHYSGKMTEKIMKKVGKAGPLVGALVGCVPQCGFSVMAANLYSGGLISVGTVIAVFMATSDEAILIIMSQPDEIGQVGRLILVKVIIAVMAGYFVDLFFKKIIEIPKTNHDLCHHCGCDEGKASIVLPAWRHTWRIFIYLFVFTGILNFVIEVFGVGKISTVLLGNTVYQPIIAVLIGLIPNCAGSVILTQLYLSGAISFASVISGLCAGTGVGLVVLFKTNKHRKENFKILGLIILIAVMAGILVEFVGNFI